MANTRGQTYFTCTLSEALEYNRAKGVRVESTENGVISVNSLYQDINGFVDFLAQNYGNHLAVGCVVPAKQPEPGPNQPAEKELLNFEDVQRLSKAVGLYLRRKISTANVNETSWVALVASSSIVFLLVWLGLLRAGYKVLLIAYVLSSFVLIPQSAKPRSPQSPVQTVQNLLHLSQVIAICHDSDHRSIIEAIDRTNCSESKNKDGTSIHIYCFEIPWKKLDDVTDSSNNVNCALYPHADPVPSKSSDIAYSFHSSGTTGLPKLIPQTQHGAVGVLPLFHDLNGPENIIPGTFTTTPLYSGGVADLFRSWSQAAPLWLFPEKRLPITAPNLLSCIRMVDEICETLNSFRSTQLRYLSCVPFVLEPVTEDPDLLNRLSQMDKVGVGGAAMPKALGDRLVAHKIPLVSRFGSSENGFLLSSDRDFTHDKGWDVLRSHRETPLEFRKLDQNDDRFELVVPATWPLVCIASHATRPFNTNDVFVSTLDRPYEWYYKGRSDAQLTLKTGKKFDPSDMEALLRSDDQIEDAIVIGDGQIAPGLLVFLSEHHDHSENVEREQKIQQIVEEANTKMPKHARVTKQYVYLQTYAEISRIRKNNKGGVVRSSVEADFAHEISQLYDTEEKSHFPSRFDSSSRESIVSSIRDIVQEQINSDIDLRNNEDLFEAGLDSQGCMTMCGKIERALRIKMTSSMVYECGTIETLASRIANTLGFGDDTAIDQSNSIQPKLQEMQRMVEECVKSHSLGIEMFAGTAVVEQPRHADVTNEADKTVLLTGSTGFLGVHILSLLLADIAVSRIFLLIRGSRTTSDEEQEETARARVKAALLFHQLNQDTILTAFDTKCTFVPFFLQEDDLGITELRRKDIINSVTHFIHVAWEVNFNLPLKAFTKHVTGTIKLYNMAALATHRREDIVFCFCSSVASIQNLRSDGGNDIRYHVSTNPEHASHLGYGQSKWVTEQVLHRLSDRNARVSLLLLRIGQLSGDTINGIWNRREAWPLMIDASTRIVSHDDHENEENKCNAPQIVTFPDLAHTPSPPLDWLPVDHAAQAVVSICNTRSQSSKCLVQPVCNEKSSIDWPTMQQYISNWTSAEGFSFKLLPAHEWLDKLERSQEPHQAKALIPLWRKNWTTKANNDTQRGNFNHKISKDNMSVLDTKFVFGEMYMRKVLTWVARSG